VSFWRIDGEKWVLFEIAVAVMRNQRVCIVVTVCVCVCLCMSVMLGVEMIEVAGHIYLEFYIFLLGEKGIVVLEGGNGSIVG
jgi:hypothetical protein